MEAVQTPAEDAAGKLDQSLTNGEATADEAGAGGTVESAAAVAETAEDDAKDYDGASPSENGEKGERHVRFEDTPHPIHSAESGAGFALQDGSQQPADTAAT